MYNAKPFGFATEMVRIELINRHPASHIYIKFLYLITSAINFRSPRIISKKIPAATYSPVPSPAKYHRPLRS